jgi:hypothetical protein
MFGSSHQSFSTRIVVQIVEFCLPESFGLNLNWMATGLPNPSVPVCSGGGATRFIETRRHATGTEVSDATACEFPEFGDRRFQRTGIEPFIKTNKVKMGRHDYKRIDPQPFLSVTEIEAANDDLTCVCRDEDRQPIDDAKGQVKQGSI